MSAPPEDRFAPESYEDFLSRGKTARERLAIEARIASEEREDQERQAQIEADRAMAEVNFYA